MLKRTVYQTMVAAIKRDIVSDFDQAMQKRRDEAAFEVFMRKILAPLN